MTRPLSRDWCTRATRNPTIQLVTLVALNDDETVISQLSPRGLSGEELHQEIMREAEGHAAGSGGVVRLRVIARTEEGDIVTSASFAIDGGAPVETDGSSEDPSSPSGHLAQAWRHNEALMRMVTMGMAGMMQHLGGTIQAQAAQIETLRRREVESYETVERLKDKQHQRNMEEKKQADDAEFRKGMLASFLPNLNMLLAKVAGPQFVKPPMGDFDIMARNFFHGLKGEQIEALINTGAFSKPMLTSMLTALEKLVAETQTVEQRKEENSKAEAMTFGSLLNGGPQ